MANVVGFSRVALLCGFVRIVATTCFFPNGDSDPAHFPCYPNEEVSSCCAEGHGCLSNGFCNDYRYPNWTRVLRGGCTAEKWDDKACGTLCLDVWPQNDQAVGYCGNGEYCCENAWCCDDAKSVRFKLDEPKVVAYARNITVSTTRTPPASSSTGTAAAATTTSKRTSTKPKKKDTLALGLGVGVGIGVSLIIMQVMACLYLRRRKRRKQKMAHELEGESTVVEEGSSKGADKYGKGSGPRAEMSGERYHELSAVGPLRELEGDEPKEMEREGDLTPSPVNTFSSSCGLSPIATAAMAKDTDAGPLPDEEYQIMIKPKGVKPKAKKRKLSEMKSGEKKNGDGTNGDESQALERQPRKQAEIAGMPQLVFRNAAAREALAVQRQKEAEEETRRKESLAKKKEADRATLMEEAKKLYGLGAASLHLDGPAIPRGPKAMRDERDTAMAPPPRPANKPTFVEMQATEQRRRYMGVEGNQSTFSAKKKRKRTTDKKFNFDWNEEDDTTVLDDPLYMNRKVAVNFGRGGLAGYDESMQDGNFQNYLQALIDRDPVTGEQRAAEARRIRDAGRGRSRAAIEKHWTKKALSEMKERDWRIMKEDFNISVKGGSIPHPLRNWDEAHLPKALLDIVDEIGYNEPSAIQRAAIPLALQERDLIGVAVTGSGKTAAFILPLLVYIMKLPRMGPHNKNSGPYALVLAPTRELAQQIEAEARKFAAPLGFNTAVITGGHAHEDQALKMRDGAEIIIATPGRLLDCIERRLIVLSQCRYVIMDEADRMIDMGFEEPVNNILSELPLEWEKPDDDRAEDTSTLTKGLYRQTMMYTATMPSAVERIAKKYLRRPAIINIGNTGEAVETVEQRVEMIPGEDKRKKRIAEILDSGEFGRPIIVFVNIKRNCDSVARDIRNLGWSTVTLHGSKTQDQREEALASLRDGRADILVATDLAGRGLDVPDVSLVINFNMPPSIEAYTHRIGRTGRAGKSGVAITFWGEEDRDTLYDLRMMLSKSQISKVPEDLKKHDAAQAKGGKGRGTGGQGSILH
ncbi:DEAD-domain-containing protein [Amniculicola lignicola CBS 123094]|uniref:RNA helicase n=1 Tax=Amniculicola lignicola CBS 123094 TaxID=1392246 RepID=A0A6A5WC06_9PLEO|nr:DEAD-domain-containing protein [Amniculicola lignicola CBS 123094]